MDHLTHFKQNLITAFKAKFELELTQIDFETPPKPDYGDLAIACFNYAKSLKLSPNIIAKEWAQEIEVVSPIESVESLGPYLNIRFDYQALAKLLQTTYLTGFNQLEYGAGKKILIEFSAPNANKPLHLGHARNNLIGEFLAKLSKKIGFEVVKVNLINDRGIHICQAMLGYQMLEAEKIKPKPSKSDHLVGEYYTEYNARLKTNPSLKEEASQMLIAWEQNDPEVRALWKKITSLALEGIKQTYLRTSISFDKYYFESELYSGGKEIVYKALEDKIAYRLENGAIAIDITLPNGQETTKVLLRGDDTALYMTQDLNTSQTKLKDFKPDYAWWVVGSEQIYHFEVLIAILEKLSKSNKKPYEHISYGMIELPEGKMKSREGKRVDLDDLCDQLQTKASQLLQNKSPDKYIEGEELKAKAEAIGQAALNYFVLRTNANKKIVFNKEESLSFDGMTGPYLQYTYVRISSMLAKLGNENIKNEPDYKYNASEKELIALVYKFDGLLIQAWEARNPSLLAHFAYDLAKAYNSFYQNYSIMKAESNSAKIARINLSRLVKEILAQTFELLSIKPIQSM